MAYPRQHKLDGIYFHIKRDDEYKDICFSDLTRDEQYSIMNNKDKSWLKELNILLADTLYEIGEQFKLYGEPYND